MRRFVNALLLGTLCLHVGLSSADPDGLLDVPEAAPAPPAPIEDGTPILGNTEADEEQTRRNEEELEPDVTIVQKKDATIEEYRLNGRLYMVKVVPVVGKPYYLVDKDGDGLMESKMSSLYNDPVVPQWVIFSW
ncbi:MAG: DUF2782 domain-containing protein [Gammaproteobacteria bacterium]|nr:DUF2782 domain-containing protein [Gammaproteobacteria bacterium]